ncbi:MAG: hypothetical protein MR471_00785 [Clostridia bacterium]|nr:hypothetical protein [Clostridia bacterium]
MSDKNNVQNPIIEQNRDEAFYKGKKLKKNLGLGLIAFAGFFLFNPDLAVIDLLPDFIGYIFMSAGLSLLADINDYMFEARKRFKLMIYVGIAKSVSLFFMFGLTNSANLPYAFLLYPFVFGVIELILLIPAYNNLFDGFLYLGARNGGDSPYLYELPDKETRRLLEDRCFDASAMNHAKHEEKNISERMLSLTKFFVIAKMSLSVLPEFSVLTNTSYDDVKRTSHLYDYIGLLRFFAIFIALIIGIVWLVKMLRYIGTIKSDTVFIENLKENYRENVLSKFGLMTRRRINVGFVFLKLAAILSLDLYLSYYNAIPDVLFPIAAIAGIYIIKRYVAADKYKKSVAALTVYGIVSLFASAVNIYYMRHYEVFEEVFRSEKAYDTYILMCISTLAEGIAFVFALIMIFKALGSVIENHCGYIGHSCNTEFIENQQRELFKELKQPFNRITVFAVLSALMGVIYDLSKQYQTSHSFLPADFIKNHEVAAMLIQDSLPNAVWFIEFVFTLIFAMTFIGALNDIFYAVKQRYMIENDDE